MIDRGACLYQGASDQLLDSGGTRVVATPEAPGDLRRLEQALVASGHHVEFRSDDLVVVADGADPRSVAGAVSRDATAAGVVLARLETVAASLEDRYLEMVARRQDGGER